MPKRRHAPTDNPGKLYSLITEHGEYQYTCIIPVRKNMSRPENEGQWEEGVRHIFISAQRVGGHEVLYGSIPQSIDEAVRPLLRAMRIMDLGVPDGAMEESVLLHQQEEILKDALLLSTTPVRTLLEDFNNRGQVRIPIYDYEGNPAGEVSMLDVFHTLAHHRYCVISGKYVHDVFSREGKLGSHAALGAKMITEDLFNAVFQFVSQIRVRDFAGVLRGRLERLNVESDSDAIIFAIQNMRAIGRIFAERMDSDATASKFVSYLFSRFTKQEEQQMREADERGENEVQIVRAFGVPAFSLDPDLTAKRIRMHISINGRVEEFDFSRAELLQRLVHSHGDESLVSHSALVKRFEFFEQESRAT
ncbi:MAG: hypothetical protein F4X66_09460 [Chloroflexi bacterium]|nr:hypothetical protein [Chloroflexota bacterium]